MSKAVLISIRPQWCELIASGQKTVEVRKTKPNLPTPFKCYIYCTKENNDRNPNKNFWKMDSTGFNWLANGRIIGEFVCDAISPITFDRAGIPTLHYCGPAKRWTTCMSVQEAIKYCGNIETHGLFGWHISQLEIYDKPKELSEYYRWNGWYHEQLEKPPQSWMYVEDL